MKTWIDLYDQGRQRLVRQGLGRVTAVSAVDDSCFRVEIDVDLPRRLSRAVRYRTQAVLAADHPLLDDACEALAWDVDVVWAIEWTPLAELPAHVAIESLDLATEAQARLVALTCLATEHDPVSARTRGEAP